MKAINLFIPVLALFPLLSCCCCTKKNVPMPGEFVDYSNPRAPKFIKSKEITSFEYEFEFSGLYESSDKSLPYFYCRFSIVREDDGARCKGEGYCDSSVVFEFDLKKDFSVLDELQKIVDKHQLAKRNGIDRFTNGLPHSLGARLKIVYASGEKIFVADNSSSVLDEKADVDIHDFFMGFAK